MCRLRLLLLGMIVAVSCVAESSAGDLTGKTGITPQVGLVMPIQALQSDDGGGNAKSGFAGGLTVEYFINDNVAVGGRFVFNRFSMDLNDPVSGNWTIMEFGVFSKYLFLPGNPTRPFARGGFAFGKTKQSIDYGDLRSLDGQYRNFEADFTLSFGLELAGGVVHEVKDNIAIYGEIGWTVLATDGVVVDVTQGEIEYSAESLIHLQWIGVKAGVTFLVGGE